MAQNSYSSLAINKTEVKEAKAIRQKSIDDAVMLSTGPSRKEMDLHVLWNGMGYEVGVGKPGKETERSKAVNPNLNDMWPYIRKGQVFEEKSATFDDIFRELEHMGNQSPHALELLGCILIRSAFMLDHKIVEDRVVYVPPEDVIKEIEKHIASMFNVPLVVFLQYLDAIALNEDVKYQRRLNGSGKPYSKDAGRPNNLLTCAHLISVLLGRGSMVTFATGFAKQRGVSALKGKNLASYFPYLDLDRSDAVEIAKEVA